MSVFSGARPKKKFFEIFFVYHNFQSNTLKYKQNLALPMPFGRFASCFKDTCYFYFPMFPIYDCNWYASMHFDLVYGDIQGPKMVTNMSNKPIWAPCLNPEYLIWSLNLVTRHFQLLSMVTYNWNWYMSMCCSLSFIRSVVISRAKNLWEICHFYAPWITNI